MSYLYPHFRPRTPQPAETIRNRCKTIADEYANHSPLPDSWKATTTGVLQAACYYGAEHRHSVLAYLFGATSSAGLTDGQWWALYAWVLPHPIGEDCLPIGCTEKADKWHCHNAVPQEIKNILDARLIEQGQTKMFESAP